MRQRKTNQCLAQIHILNPCVWILVIFGLSFSNQFHFTFTMFQIVIMITMVVIRYKRKKIQNWFEKFKPKNEICC